MPFDQAPQIESAPAPKFDLPEITGVKIQYASFTPKATRNFANPLTAVQDAVEIVVTLKSPLPIRAMAPVLHVGDARLTESEPVDKEGKQIRFWALDRTQLKPGAPVSMAWSGQAPPQVKTKPKFTFSLPQ